MLTKGVPRNLQKHNSDLEKSNELTFDEFIIVLCRYCMFTKENILDYCFSTFDRDNSGTIDEDEFIMLAQWLQTKTPIFPGNLQTAMETFDVDDDGCLNKKEFHELWKRYPLILFPAFRVQSSLQKAYLGEDYWKWCAEDVKREAEIKKWRRTHGGAFPVEPRSEQVKRVSLGKHNCYSGKPSLPPIATQKKLVTRRAKKKKKG